MAFELIPQEMIKINILIDILNHGNITINKNKFRYVLARHNRLINSNYTNIYKDIDIYKFQKIILLKKIDLNGNICINNYDYDGTIEHFRNTLYSHYTHEEFENLVIKLYVEKVIGFEYFKNNTMYSFTREDFLKKLFTTSN